ncbi:MAG: hypothetical protein M5U12_01565 [Verrucomicrobia bacterium]|nr:hypothetical protein [Verrucomicrobiota bacterium]
MDQSLGRPLTEDGVWLEVAWDQPQPLRHVQITFDTGFHRELTLSASTGVSQRVIRAPQPETVRDYTLLYLDPAGNGWRELVRVQGNHQRLVRHSFDPLQTRALRLHITATNGEAIARVYELRAYA